MTRQVLQCSYILRSITGHNINRQKFGALLDPYIATAPLYRNHCHTDSVAMEGVMKLWI